MINAVKRCNWATGPIKTWWLWETCCCCCCCCNHFTAPGTLSRTTRVSRYQKDKTNMDLLEQEIVSGSGMSWAICKSAPRPRHVTTPASHHSVFTGLMPFLPPNEQHQSTEGRLWETFFVICSSGLICVVCFICYIVFYYPRIYAKCRYSHGSSICWFACSAEISDHYYQSRCLSVCLSVILSSVLSRSPTSGWPIWMKLGS